MKYYYLKVKSLINFKSIIKMLFLMTLVFCLGSSNLMIYTTKGQGRSLVKYDISFEEFILDQPSLATVKRKDVMAKFNAISKKANPLMELYINNNTNVYIVDYFTKFTGDRKISLSILYYSYKYQLPPQLSFALAWTESRFVKSAINHNNNLSIDRGLFQLNSKTFTNLENNDFFDPDVNALHGLKYLSWCLKQGESEYNALIIYNAGIGRLSTPPESTLAYTSRIMEKEKNIKESALSYVKKAIQNDKNLSDENDTDNKHNNKHDDADDNTDEVVHEKVKNGKK